MRGSWGWPKDNDQAPHTTRRTRRVRDAIKLAYETLSRTGDQRTADSWMHNTGGDIRILAEHAARWEDHCRKTGQDVYRWTNEDGTPDTESVGT